MLVIDLMHEFELGVWKALFIRLICILSAAETGDTLVNELDHHYRMVPMFGDTIRKFTSNTSEMKRMAARDFEDALQVSRCLGPPCPHILRYGQCAIPVFDALLPEPHNKNVLALLFTCAYWHALAKLCMHTDETLTLLDTVTKLFGKRLRHFQQKTCSAFGTRELRWEADCRHRRGQRNLATNSTPAASTSQATRRQKTFNLQTYKLHALGDYATSIRKYGTTDSYSTESASTCTENVLLTYRLTGRAGTPHFQGKISSNG